MFLSTLEMIPYLITQINSKSSSKPGLHVGQPLSLGCSSCFMFYIPYTLLFFLSLSVGKFSFCFVLAGCILKADILRYLNLLSERCLFTLDKPSFEPECHQCMAICLKTSSHLGLVYTEPKTALSCIWPRPLVSVGVPRSRHIIWPVCIGFSKVYLVLLTALPPLSSN